MKQINKNPLFFNNTFSNGLPEIIVFLSLLVAWLFFFGFVYGRLNAYDDDFLQQPVNTKPLSSYMVVS